MGSSNLDIDVDVLADWIEQRAGERLWAVDGEEHIAGALSLPCPGRELANFLRNRGGKLRVFGALETTAASVAKLEELAENEDGALIFEVAWLENGAEGARWILAEDKLAEDAEQATN